MRTILLTALCMSALAGVASAQNAAPNTVIHPSGSLSWPRSNSFAYLRGQGLDKDEVSIAVENAAPEGRSVTVGQLTHNNAATTATRAMVAARVADYGYMPSSWTGTWDEWTKHQDMCATRYKTYSRSDDKYFYKVGEKTYCNLGLKDAR